MMASPRSGVWTSAALAASAVLAACSSDSADATRRVADAAIDAGPPSPAAHEDGGARRPPRDAGTGKNRPPGSDASTPDASIRDAGRVVEAGDEPPRDAASDANQGHEPRFAWHVYYGQSYAAHVEVDRSGAAIVSGTVFDSHDVVLGSHTLTSHGAADVMLSRVLPDGTVDWARAYGSPDDDYPVSFALGKNDEIGLVGLYDGSGNIGGPSFPAFAGTPSRYDAYVAGLAANGDHRWSHAVTSTAEAFAGPGLALDGEGSLLVPGSFLGSVTVDATARASKGSWDAFYAKYTEAQGGVSAPLTFGGPGDDRASQVVVTGAGDIVLLGRFQGQVVFPTTPPTTLTSAGGTDVFVARMTAEGAMSSVVAFGGAGDEDVARARLDARGDIIVGGVFTSRMLSVLGGEPLASAGGKDCFVAALSPSLAHLWSVRFGGDADDYLRDLATSPSGKIAVTGEFRDSVTFGATTWAAARTEDAATSDIDFFVATLGDRGAPLWSHTAGGTGADRGLNVAIDAQDGVYVTASFLSPTDFGGGELLPAPPGNFASALVRYAP
jgi:hypothetical protein